MAISITESQGTLASLVATTTATSTVAEIITALSGGKSIGCVQNIGDVTTSRSVQEYKCLSSDEVAKSLGSISLPNITMDLLFSAADTAGQADLRLMYSANTRRKLILTLNDKPAGTVTNPTYIVFEVGMSTDGVSIAIDNAVMFKAVLEICSKPIMTLAAVTTP